MIGTLTVPLSAVESIPIMGVDGGGGGCSGGNYRSAKLEEMSGTGPRRHTHVHSVSLHVFYYVSE